MLGEIHGVYCAFQPDVEEQKEENGGGFTERERQGK